MRWGALSPCTAPPPPSCSHMHSGPCALVCTNAPIFPCTHPCSHPPPSYLLPCSPQPLFCPLPPSLHHGAPNPPRHPPSPSTCPLTSPDIPLHPKCFTASPCWWHWGGTPCPQTSDVAVPSPAHTSLKPSVSPRPGPQQCTGARGEGSHWVVECHTAGGTHGA